MVGMGSSRVHIMMHRLHIFISECFWNAALYTLKYFLLIPEYQLEYPQVTYHNLLYDRYLDLQRSRGLLYFANLTSFYTYLYLKFILWLV